jgi:aspartate/methionine/tyrosine aminotransferase
VLHGLLRRDTRVVYVNQPHNPTGTERRVVLQLAERAVSLGSISKTYGLRGLCIGWIATRDPGLRARIVDLKHYTTICASAPSELLTTVALRHRERLVDRNLGIVRRNLPLLDAFLERHAAHFS